MNKLLIGMLSLFLVACAANKKSIEPYFENSSGLQIIEIATAHVGDSKGTASLYERNDTTASWQLIHSFPVVVGRNGFAGESLQAEKKEGDGCSPAGSFTLGKVFSYHNIADLHMPFEQVDKNDLCVDDIHSAHYNLLVDDDTISNKDYTSFERMQRDDAQYEYGVWVNYNTAPQIAGAGSCIFLHIWKGPETGTSGCTAMSKENMLTLIHWLDEKKMPLLIQKTQY